MVSRPFGSPSALSSVALGSAANASFVGANTVMPSAELSVSTRPALVTAVTRVLRAGLCDAAVATGSMAMPSKLPGPSFGTAAQPAPKTWSAAASAVGDAGIATRSGAEPRTSRDEPQAASANGAVTSSAAAATRREGVRMGSSRVCEGEACVASTPHSEPHDDRIGRHATISVRGHQAPPAAGPSEANVATRASRRLGHAEAEGRRAKRGPARRAGSQPSCGATQRGA